MSHIIDGRSCKNFPLKLLLEKPPIHEHFRVFSNSDHLSPRPHRGSCFVHSVARSAVWIVGLPADRWPMNQEQTGGRDRVVSGLLGDD
ncbi:MAG: hypothetical protein QOH06_3835 [Acidobacteriota bacterium]|jgi:hypothetical protein|nr:hypothetical protein [Acidobacteriota bacterium]